MSDIKIRKLIIKYNNFIQLHVHEEILVDYIKKQLLILTKYDCSLNVRQRINLIGKINSINKYLTHKINEL